MKSNQPTPEERLLRRKISRALIENYLRWANNTLIELNANHAGPQFPKTRESLMEISRQIESAQRALREDSKNDK